MNAAEKRRELEEGCKNTKKDKMQKVEETDEIERKKSRFESTLYLFVSNVIIMHEFAWYEIKLVKSTGLGIRSSVF